MVSDHLGSAAVLTDQTGAVVERDAYDAWGKRRNLNGTDDTACALVSQTTRGFTGHEHIDDLCLIDANARLYDPILGRFLSPDDTIPEPTDMQSFNRFSYVRNRPLSVTDPTGHDDVNRSDIETVVVDAWRTDAMFWNDFENSIDYSVGNILSGLTSWGTSAADATAGTAAPPASTGGSKPQNDKRNAEKHWKITNYHNNGNGTLTVSTQYVDGTVDDIVAAMDLAGFSVKASAEGVVGVRDGAAGEDADGAGSSGCSGCIQVAANAPYQSGQSVQVPNNALLQKLDPTGLTRVPMTPVEGKQLTDTMNAIKQGTNFGALNPHSYKNLPDITTGAALPPSPKGYTVFYILGGHWTQRVVVPNDSNSHFVYYTDTHYKSFYLVILPP